MPPTSVQTVRRVDTRSYNAMSRIVNNLQIIPGRKAAVVFSDNVPPITMPLPMFADQTLRTATTVYQCALPGWRLAWSDLSDHTGGYGAKAKSDSFPEIEQVLQDFDQCYLLGYMPDAKALDFKGAPFSPKPASTKGFAIKTHFLKIKVKAPGLKVRTRSSFSDLSLLQNANRYPALPAGKIGPMVLIGGSPFLCGNLGVTAEALPLYSPKKESIIRAVLHIKGEDLLFGNEPEDGNRVAKLNITGQVYLDGISKNTYAGTAVFGAPVPGFREHVARGFTTTFDVPVAGPGFYELRATIRQNESGRNGNVSVMVEVPEFARAGLVASGIASFNIPKEPISNQGVPPTTRRIHRSVPFACLLSVYNARRDRTGGKTQIESQLRLYRDDELIKASEVVPAADRGTDAASNEIPISYSISPGPELTAGNYLLEILIIDRLADKKHGTTAQSAAIELVD